MNRPQGPLTPTRFVDVFAEGWRLPKPDAFLDYFRPLMHPEVTLIQPPFPEARGVEGFETLFRQMFALLPDFTATVQRSTADDRAAVIESACMTRLGGRTIHFDVCDRFTIDDGLIIQRRSYSDPSPVLLAMLRSPAAWPRATRGFYRLRKRHL
jgi:limonene-1,2-epoxide hydrolase